MRAARAGDETVLLHLDRGSYYTLNATGACVWDRLESGASSHELLAALVAQFEVDAATAAADLEGLLAELLAAGLVERDAPG